MKNKSKTTLFAALIVAMILPFSNMDMATAQETKRTFDEIVVEAISLDKKLRTEDLTETQKDDIKSRLTELEKEYNQAADAKSKSKVKKRSAASNFAIDAYNIGCDLNIDKLFAKGTIYSGSTSFWISYSFPQNLSHGTWPNCHDDSWNNNLNIVVQKVFPNTGIGCIANWTTSYAASHKANCTISAGLWSIALTGEYQHQTLSGVGYVTVL